MPENKLLLFHDTCKYSIIHAYHKITAKSIKDPNTSNIVTAFTVPMLSNLAFATVGIYVITYPAATTKVDAPATRPDRAVPSGMPFVLEQKK